MKEYLLKRLLLLPITLFIILLVNFTILNLAPGDPVTITPPSPDGSINRQESRSIGFGSDAVHLQFREHYGLTRPILLNTWVYMDRKDALDQLKKLKATQNVKDYNALKTEIGDQSQFIMSDLLAIAKDPQQPFTIRQLAVSYFIRGGWRPAYLGHNLSPEQKIWNQKIVSDTLQLEPLYLDPEDSSEEIQKKLSTLDLWYRQELQKNPPLTAIQKFKSLFLDTRFSLYLSKIFTLDFGSLRNNSDKKVIHEVIKRFKYSLTLAVIPMILTFILCTLLGYWMALYHNKPLDHLINFFCLILYAAPVFVIAPLLIEKVALGNTFFFTDTPIPMNGFSSSETIYNGMTSWQRFFDILKHLLLPFVAVMYGSLAAQSRLSKAVFLDVMKQDFVRQAKAKGLDAGTIFTRYLLRNSSIAIVTSLAGSLGVLLGGFLIVETLFEIDGFGKFFYEAILNRDYNVILFSTLAGSFLSLLGYLVADIAYTVLDPRVRL